MNLKHNYIEVNCCYKCKHSVDLGSYEDMNLYCEYDGLPPVADMYLGCSPDPWITVSPEKQEAKIKAKEWMVSHSVCINGLCDNFANK